MMSISDSIKLSDTGFTFVEAGPRLQRVALGLLEAVKVYQMDSLQPVLCAAEPAAIAKPKNGSADIGCSFRSRTPQNAGGPRARIPAGSDHHQRQDTRD
jgi:hypothetical protein